MTKKVQIRPEKKKKDLKAAKETKVFNNDGHRHLHYTTIPPFCGQKHLKCHIDIGICAKMFKIKKTTFFFILENPTFYMVALLTFSFININYVRTL